MAIEPIGRFSLGTNTVNIGVVPFQNILVTTVSHPSGIVPFGTRMQVLRQSAQFYLLSDRIDVVLWAELTGTTLGATTIIPIATPFGWTANLQIISPNVTGLTVDISGANNVDLTN